MLELPSWAETRSTIELPALKIRVVGDSTRHIPQRISLLHNRGWGVTSQSQVTEAGGLPFHHRQKRLEGYLSSSQVIEAGGLAFIITVNCESIWQSAETNKIELALRCGVIRCISVIHSKHQKANRKSV